MYHIDTIQRFLKEKALPAGIVDERAVSEIMTLAKTASHRGILFATQVPRIMHEELVRGLHWVVMGDEAWERQCVLNIVAVRPHWQSKIRTIEETASMEGMTREEYIRELVGERPDWC